MFCTSSKFKAFLIQFAEKFLPNLILIPFFIYLLGYHTPLKRYDTLKKIIPNLILWKVVVLYEHADPKRAQKYTNWLCCCHGNVLVCIFVEF